MSAFTRLAVFAALLEPLLGCPPGGTGGPTGTCPADATRTSAVAAAIGSEPTCGDWGCGTNSATLADGLVFDELNVAGEPDRHGLRIDHVVIGSVTVKLQLDRHRLVARATDGSGRMFTNGGLFGMVITLEKEGVKYDIKLDGVDENTLHFWAGDTTEIAPFYKFLVKIPTDNDFKTPLCRMNIASKEKVWEGVEHSALAFVGDRYDPVTKTVIDAEPGTPWFNLACAGTATAKMHLMRHTNAGAWTNSTWRTGMTVNDPGAPFHTAIPERLAMLKMFAADYCGNGHTFTVDGQPLMYGDHRVWYPSTPTSGRLAAPGTTPPYVATMEALWGPGGAVCLDTPRLASIADVHAVCAPPPCGGIANVIGWEKKNHVISANGPCSPAPPAP